MQIVSASDPVYVSPTNSAIRCLLLAGGMAEPAPYVAADGDAVSQELFDRLKAGEFGAVAPYAAPPGPALAVLVGRAQAAASAAAGSIIAQVYPDEARKAALQNAASIVNANSGAAPTTGPFVEDFDDLAASYGLSAASFATVVITAQAASMTLGAALTRFRTDSGAASTPEVASAAIDAFQRTLDAVVTRLDAVFPVPLQPPAPIVIAGLNA